MFGAQWAVADYDLLIIGGGSAGLTAATIAGRVGARVLLVDKEKLGGDCLHTGCVPSKSLIAAAKRVYEMKSADRLGVPSHTPTVDLGRVMARIRGVQDSIAQSDSPEHLATLGVEVRFGGAAFLDPHTVTVGDDRVTADRFIIATGSKPRLPPIEGLAEVDPLTNETVFELNSSPGRLAVVGGGPIGCELAQALSRLGSEVTLFQRGDRLLTREEPEVSGVVQAALSDEMSVLFSTQIKKVWLDGGETVVAFAREGKMSERRFDRVLVATGRSANTTSLNLEAAEVETKRGFVVSQDDLRTSQKHIYAAGDVNGGPAFTHWAEYEARIATRNALFRGKDRRSMNVVPWVTFVDPEVARVGLTEAEARAEHDEVSVYRYDFAELDRALCEGEPRGFAQVVVSKDRILGAHIVGLGAGESIGEWVMAMTKNLSLRDVGEVIHVYPTRSRINRRLSDQPFLKHGLPGWMMTLGARFSPRGDD